MFSEKARSRRCRVSIDGQTRFTCVDGPIFDGHSVDWDELFSRRDAYARVEIEALPQTVEIMALCEQQHFHNEVAVAAADENRETPRLTAHSTT